MLRIRSANSRKLRPLLVILVSLIVPRVAAASDECDMRNIADMVKTISILRQVENSLNFLALSQVDAIVDIATGVHTLELYNDESGFYGPLIGLRKATDKNELVLSNLDKAIHRLATYEVVQIYYDDMRERTEQIIGAGRAVLGALEAGDPPAATQIYADITVGALNQARAEAYTAMSNLERSVSLAGVHCK